jgi:hypothetical protein
MTELEIKAAVRARDGLSRKIDRLEKENKRLREEAKGWKVLHDSQAAVAERLRKENSVLQDQRLEITRLRAELASIQMDGLLKPDVIATWFRSLSRQFHPDSGGTDEQMKVVNEAHELLVKLLRSS